MHLPVPVENTVFVSQTNPTAIDSTDLKLTNGEHNNILLGGKAPESARYHRALVSNNASVSHVTIENTNRYPAYKGGLYLRDRATANGVTVTQGQVQLLQKSVLSNAIFSKNSMLDMHAGTANHIQATDTRLYVYQNSKVNDLKGQHDLVHVEGEIQGSQIQTSKIGLMNEGVIKNTQLHQNAVTVFGTKGTFDNVKGDSTLRFRTNLMTGKTDKLNVKNHWEGQYKIDIKKTTANGVATTGEGIEIIQSTPEANQAKLSLAHPVQAGLLQYNLNQHNGNVYLKSGMNSAVTTNSAQPEATSNYDLNTLEGLDFQLLGHKDFWITQYGSRANMQRYNAKLTDYTLYTQVGGTLYKRQRGNQQWKTGLALSVGQSRLSSNALNSRTLTTKGKTIASFIEWQDPNNYVDWINQFGFYRNSDMHSRGFTSALAYGHHFHLAHNNTLTPQAQLIYQQLRFPAYQLTGELSHTRIEAMKQHQVLGNVGFTFRHDAQNGVHTYAQASVYHRFQGFGNLNAMTDQYQQSVALFGAKTWLSTKVGTDIDWTPNLSVLANIGYQRDLDAQGNQINGTVSLNYTWK